MTANVYHFHLYGSRESKFAWLNENDLSSTDFAKLAPQSPFHLFIPQNTDFLDEYQRYWKITDIFINENYATGIVTTHDEFAISWDAKEAVQKVRTLLNTNDESEARGIFKLCSQNQWNYNRAKQELQSDEWEKQVCSILYRPFDIRWTIYNRNIAVHRRERIMSHILAGNNIGLCTDRQVNGNFQHILCTKYIINDCTLSLNTKERTYLFPLYLYPKQGEVLEEKRRVNFSEAFLSEATQKLGKFTPEEMLSYIYAIFHSPTYRSRYAEFLKTDFPRVPLTSDRRLFESLSELGKELIAVHLLEKPLTVKTKFPIIGTNEVGTVKYDSGKVWINKTQYIHIVDENIWKFHIGGYQVCQKWLKDRKGRKLGFDDLRHYGRIVATIEETIRIMAEIDNILIRFQFFTPSDKSPG